MTESDGFEDDVNSGVPDDELLKKARQTSQDVDAYNRAKDRSLIVSCVAILYVFAIGAAILYLIIYGAVTGNEDTFDNISEIIKVAVIPIVTLVFGYYFASRST